MPIRLLLVWMVAVFYRFLDWIGPKCIECVECEYYRFSQVKSIALRKLPNQTQLANALTDGGFIVISGSCK